MDQLEKLVEKAVESKIPNDVGDTSRYGGRDRLITDLINRINDEKLNFLKAGSASNSSKSSLVRRLQMSLPTS